jgi:hypothetical protein
MVSMRFDRQKTGSFESEAAILLTRHFKDDAELHELQASRYDTVQ